MEFGIAFPSYVDAWRDCEAAEAAGFTHAWFYDTQLLCSDVYAVMALAAEHTRTMTLGTLVAIPSNRIAPVTAERHRDHQRIAPGRTILGVGTGFTGRNTMGMPPLPVAPWSSTCSRCAGCWRAKTCCTARAVERWIRLLSRDRRLGCINLDDPIPIHIAANAPKALAAVGRWATAGSRSRRTRRRRRGPGGGRAAAKQQGRTFAGGKPYTTLLTTGCVLRDGERSMRRASCARRPGHGRRRARDLGERARGHGFGSPRRATAAAFERYIEAYAAGSAHRPIGATSTCTKGT
jgi:hypothetical protein